MLAWIIIIVIVVLVVNAGKGKGKNGARPSGTAPAKAANNNVISIRVDQPESYSSVLNTLENIVHSVVSSSYCEVNVVVQVRKIDRVYCMVACSLLADTAFNGIAFGEGFRMSGDDHAVFETNLATGFTTLDDVKREILIQFNWSDLSVGNAQWTVIDRGDYANTPYISYSFTVSK